MAQHEGPARRPSTKSPARRPSLCAREEHHLLNLSAQRQQKVLGSLSLETRADHALEGLYLGFWHLVAAREVMSGKQEHLLNACFLSRLQQAICATLWWTE